VVGNEYKTNNGVELGKYIEHKLDGHSSGGPEFKYLFQKGTLYDPNPYDADELKKLNIVIVNGGKYVHEKQEESADEPSKKTRKQNQESNVFYLA
jgi:hypothetical protein